MYVGAGCRPYAEADREREGIGQGQESVECREVTEMLVELVTPEGYKFWGESFVVIDGEDCCLDDLTQEQRSYALAVRDRNALNAAYAGQAEFTVEGLPEFHEVFPGFAEKRGRR